jgi:hypothetical protein
MSILSEYLCCGCESRCGDDGDIDGPGTCKGLPRRPGPPLLEIVLENAAHDPIDENGDPI